MLKIFKHYSEFKCKVPKESKEEILKKYRGKYNLTPSSYRYWSRCLGFLFSKTGRTSDKAEKGKKQHEDRYNEIIQELKNLREGKETKEKDFYVSWVIDKIKQTDVGVLLLEYPIIHKFSDSVGCLGFIDFLVWDNNSSTITLVDYKTGDYDISAKHNHQLALYAISFLKEYKHLKIEHIDFAIIQNNQEKVWKVDSDWLKETENNINKIVAKLDKDVVDYVYDGVRCDTCFNNINCSVYKDKKLESFDSLLKEVV